MPPVLRSAAALLLLGVLGHARADTPLLTFPALPSAPEAGASARVADLPGPTLAALRADPNVHDLRVGRASPAALLGADAVFFDPTPGAGDSVVLDRLSTRRTEPGVVHLDGLGAAARLAVTLAGPDMLGSLTDTEGRTWRLTPLGGGWTAVYRYDRSNLRRHPPGWTPWPRLQRARQGRDGSNLRRQPPGRTPEPAVAPEPGAAAGPPPRDAARTPDAPPAPNTSGLQTVDVLVVWTRAAEVYVGNPEAFVASAMDRAQRHYENSDLDDRVALRLVHATAVDYTESPDIIRDLIHLQTPDDGALDGVRALREQYGADVVHMFIDGTTPAGGGIVFCGVAYFAHHPSLRDFAYGVTAVQCESSAISTFTHELGHNFGAAHDPPNAAPDPPFAWGYGHCSLAGWATVMAYTGINNRCVRNVPYFSSPLVEYDGQPTGVDGSADNRRVLRDTAAVVADHAEPTLSAQRLPLVMPAGGAVHSLLRLTSHGSGPRALRITGFDDTGKRFGPREITLGPSASVQLTSTHLEQGEPARGFPDGLGDGTGRWRLGITGDGPFEAVALARTPNRFLVSLMGEARRVPSDSGFRYHLPVANPGSNTDRISRVRIANLAYSPARVVIDGVDDAGAPGEGPVTLSLAPQAAVMVSTAELEAGDAEATVLSGRLGDGAGKWRLLVSADRALSVVGLLDLRTGGGQYLANVSLGQPGVEPEPPPPPPPVTYDLAIEDFSAFPASVPLGEQLNVSFRLQNVSGSAAPATAVVLYRSRDAAVDPAGAFEVITYEFDPTRPSGDWDTRASHAIFGPAGTWYYAACIRSDRPDTQPGNDCSRAVRIDIPDRFGAIAWGWIGDDPQCRYGLGIATDQLSPADAYERAQAGCNSHPSNTRPCGLGIEFTACGSLAFGRTPPDDCYLTGGSGPTRAAAEAAALDACRATGRQTCRLAVDSATGRPATTCNTTAGSARR